MLQSSLNGFLLCFTSILPLSVSSFLVSLLIWLWSDSWPSSHPTRRCKEMWPLLWWLHWRTSVLCFHVAVQFHSGLPSRCSRYPTGQVCWALPPMKSYSASVPLRVIFTKSDFYSQFNISSSSFSCYILSQSSSNPISFLKISPCTSTHADVSRLWTCIYSRENINPWPKKEGAPFFWLVLFYWSIVDL